MDCLLCCLVVKDNMCVVMWCMTVVSVCGDCGAEMKAVVVVVEAGNHWGSLGVTHALWRESKKC